MLKYIVKRILQMIPMMIILSIVVFCMVRLIPGDPVTMSLGMGAGKPLPLRQPALVWTSRCGSNILSG